MTEERHEPISESGGTREGPGDRIRSPQRAAANRRRSPWRCRVTPCSHCTARSASVRASTSSSERQANRECFEDRFSRAISNRRKRNLLPPQNQRVSKTATPSPSTKKTARGAQAGGTRKWFEKGEALALFRRILKRPMRTRDLMVRVVAAKGKAQLPKKDLERFKMGGAFGAQGSHQRQCDRAPG